MLSFPLEQVDDGTGVDKEAYLMQCSCGGDVFYIFQPITVLQIHVHYQCAQCEQTYCTINACQLIRQETSEAAQGLFQG